MGPLGVTVADGRTVGGLPAAKDRAVKTANNKRRVDSCFIGKPLKKLGNVTVYKFINNPG
jgi:hypothetical protein